MQQRMNPDMGPGLEVSLELVPKLRRLVLDVPFHVLVARAEVAFLGPRRLLIAADADDYAREVMPFKHSLERVLLECAAALHTRCFAARVGAARPERLVIPAHDKLELPLPTQPVAVFNHARDLVSGINVHQREGHMTEEDRKST